ncbi:hypothetical protein DL768_004945 [Monosporascus sp. mg162]|nr:hypothetical protein DL768_004945 [Monosporascus sp. mg162]
MIDHGHFVVFTVFAKLLLEIEYGREIEVNLANDYQEGWNRLRECLSEAEKDCDPSRMQYLEAVRACLHFDSLYTEEHRTLNAAGRLEEGIVTAKRLIRSKIVANLMSQGDNLASGSTSRKRPAEESEECKVFSRTLPLLSMTNALNGIQGTKTKRARLQTDAADWTAATPGRQYPVRTQNTLPDGQGDVSGEPTFLSSGRIAVLDTGCNPDCPASSWFKAMPDEASRIENGHWHDFVGESAQPVDEDRNAHGTAVVSLLLRVARHADVFVGRIAKNSESLIHAASNVAKAIEYAAETWDVDIVTMSFGFSTSHESIRKAIRSAKDIRNRAIIFFAAAGNDGANRAEMFPAYLSSVISVRGTDCAGTFVGDYNPPPTATNDSSPLYGTLGLNVPYDFPSSNVKSGCSIATPIMAGMIALIFQFASYEFVDAHCQARLRTLEGVQQLLRDIAVKQANNRYYVHLWELFDEHGGAIALGNIITDPFKPHIVLSRPDPGWLPAKESVPEKDWRLTLAKESNLTLRIWARFRHGLGIKVGGERDKKMSAEYTMEELETVYFRDGITSNDIKERVKDPLVATLMNPDSFLSKPVYMITGMKIAKGFRLISEGVSRKGAQAGVTGPAGGGAALTAGGEASFTVGNSDAYGFSSDDIVFAYQLLKIAPKGWRKKGMQVTEYQSSATFLDDYADEVDQGGVEVEASFFTVAELDDLDTQPTFPGRDRGNLAA